VATADTDQENPMHHLLYTALADTRERELRTVVRRPDRLMARVLELVDDAPPRRGARRSPSP
jgi:hypothetical protein